MRNQYPGICYRCRERVEVGAGHYERYAGAWRVQHAECAIAYRGSDRHTQGPRPVVNPDTDRTKRCKTCPACTRSFTSRIQAQKCCSDCIQARKAAKKETFREPQPTV